MKYLGIVIAISSMLAGASSVPAFQATDAAKGVTENQSETAKRAKELIERMKKAKEAGADFGGSGGLDSQILPEGAEIAMFDEPTKAQYFDALREYYSYRISGFQHRKRVFEWQLFSSRIIFVVVIILVLSGIYFSGVQFHSSLRRKPTAESVEAGALTEIEASFKGIKVSSSILGVIILIISFLFFYLYLVHVYPINNVL